MKREAFKMFLKPGFEKEYEKRHAEIWPELKKMLSDNGVYDYSIYWDKDTNGVSIPYTEEMIFLILLPPRVL